MRYVLYCLLFIEGFVLLGFEMLASRYLNPYFGSGIDTWACIISVVLLSMMFGYMVGGNLSKRFTAISVLSIVTAISGAYMILVSIFAHGLLQTAIEDLEYGFPLLFASAVFIQALPVFLMSFWSPYLVRSLTRNIEESGSIAGLVYGISTLGNVVGTLVTAFVLIPRFGTSQISMSFGLILLFIASLIMLIHIKSGFLMNRVSLILATFLLSSGILPIMDARADNLKIEAMYPEGIYFSENGDLYFTEMTANRIMLFSNQKLDVFWQGEKCGPTGFTKIQTDSFAVACHLEPKILILNSEGKIKTRLAETTDGYRISSPNDINSDGNGGAYFSNSGVFSPKAKADGRIFHIDASLNVLQVAQDIRYANGVAYSEMNKTLYVSEHLNKRILKFGKNSDGSFSDAPKIHADFSNTPEFKNASNLAGPDGLRVMEEGSLLVGLYGTSKAAIVGSCGDVAFVEGFDKFVTSVGFYNQQIAVASAINNTKFPYAGHVHLRDNISLKVC
ncbi:MAG: fused MFS/spermidine synthase [Lentilitoribacter sp.]